jgi:hypothetical protein
MAHTMIIFDTIGLPHRGASDEEISENPMVSNMIMVCADTIGNRHHRITYSTPSDYIFDTIRLHIRHHRITYSTPSDYRWCLTDCDDEISESRSSENRVSHTKSAMTENPPRLMFAFSMP